MSVRLDSTQVYNNAALKALPDKLFDSTPDLSYTEIGQNFALKTARGYGP